MERRLSESRDAAVAMAQRQIRMAAPGRRQLRNPAR
jgi:hypothetical protein